MRFRNFVPLILFVLLIGPAGLGFIFIWEGYPLVLCGAQLFSAPLLVLIYRAGINSAKKNFSMRHEIGKIVYLPLKVNLVAYFLIGVPFVFIFQASAAILMGGYAAGCMGFALAYWSGLTYIARSKP